MGTCIALVQNIGNLVHVTYHLHLVTATRRSINGNPTNTSAMENFEAILEKATARGTTIVPGAIMGVVDSQGDYVHNSTISSNLHAC
jgi:hypothetical protein